MIPALCRLVPVIFSVGIRRCQRPTSLLGNGLHESSLVQILPNFSFRVDRFENERNRQFRWDFIKSSRASQAIYLFDFQRRRSWRIQPGLRKLARMRGASFRPGASGKGFLSKTLLLFYLDIQGRIRRARGERQPCSLWTCQDYLCLACRIKIAFKITLFLNLSAFSSKMLLGNTRPNME